MYNVVKLLNASNAVITGVPPVESFVSHHPGHNFAKYSSNSGG